MLHKLLIFKNRQEKNSCSKVAHTLLFKEKFNFLKGINPIKNVLLIGVLFTCFCVFSYFILKARMLINLNEILQNQGNFLLKELFVREIELQNLKMFLTTKITCTKDILFEPISCEMRELPDELWYIEDAITYFGFCVLLIIVLRNWKFFLKIF